MHGHFRPLVGSPGTAGSVTAVIVVRNQAQDLRQSLASLVAQDLAPGEFEILVVDGQSTDGTVQVAQGMAQQTLQPVIRVLENPKHTLAAGWNIAIREAQGEFIVRIEAHTAVARDFLSANLALHAARDAACTGGPWETRGEGFWGQIIAAVLSSRFGVGSGFRTRPDYEGYADTVPCGMYRRSAMIEAGLLDETLARNQDIHLHRRMRELGHRFFISPRVRSVYRCRSSLAKMVAQSYGNGYWHGADIRAMSARHAAPACAVLLGALCVILGMAGVKAAWIVLGAAFLLHLGLGAAASATAKLERWSQRLLMPFVCLASHISYGLGTIVGIVRLGGRNVVRRLRAGVHT